MDLILVCADKRLADCAAVFAKLLAQHGHEVESWTDKHFKAMKASLPQDYPDEKFIILGSDALVAKPNTWAWQRFGGRIGWQGGFCVIDTAPAILNAAEHQSFVEYCAAKKEIWPNIIIPPKDGLDRLGRQVKALLGEQDALYILLVHEFTETFLDAFLAAEPTTEAPALEEINVAEELRKGMDAMQNGFARASKKIVVAAETLPKITLPKWMPKKEQNSGEETTE